MTQSTIRRGRSAGLALACAGALLGCATGYNRGAIDQDLRADRPTYASSKSTVEEIERMKPQLTLPARISVVPPRGADGRSATWTPQEVAVIDSWDRRLRADGVASDLLVLPATLVEDCNEYREPGCRLAAQRAAAARVHADALVVVNLATSTDRYANPASALYLTIAGMWLVPGTHSDALTVAEGVLLDNRNEYVYAFARGEGESRSVRPILYADAAPVEAASRVEALRNLGDALVAQARHLPGRPDDAKVPTAAEVP